MRNLASIHPIHRRLSLLADGDWSYYPSLVTASPRAMGY